MTRRVLALTLCFVILGATAAYAQTQAEWTARLLAAAAEGDEDEILAAVAAGADVNARDAEKSTPLMLLSPHMLFGKERRIVEAMVKANVKIDAVNVDGTTALMWAASSGREGMVRLLLENGAKVDASDNDGWTALTYAASAGHWNAVKELIEAKANVNHKTKKGWTPLGMALFNGRGSAAENLIKAGATLPEKGGNGLSTVLLAAYGRDLASVRHVLAAERPLNDVNDEGMTALAVASFYGDGQIVMELLRSGADMSIKDTKGQTALDHAKANEHAEVVAILGGPWDKPKAKGGTNITIPCAALGGKVEANLAVDGQTLVVTTAYPKPLTWYIGGGNTNRASSAKNLVYEGSFTPSYYFDVDSNAKTGVKESFLKHDLGSEYAIDYGQYGTSVNLEYADSNGNARTKSVYANVLDVDVEKEGEMIDTSELGDDAPRPINDRGVLVSRVPLSLMKLTPGKTVRVTSHIGSCGDPVVSKVKL